MRREIIGAIIGAVLVLAIILFFLLRNQDPANCPVTCKNDDQCGGEIVRERFCRDGNVWGSGQKNVCFKPGTCKSYCETTYGDILIEKCGQSCENGICNN